ncbi:alpha/beta fold hydrolase [Actinoplanes sp. DH11]|uniref:alpha/beta fold hydrolase n=1 Tax=Actinoplanes sp. DH11 TaxID=2857011 RepID=UPI001E436B6E|nr:alpha/beta hydrolase [Actinoplanes sp. DH11]
MSRLVVGTDNGVPVDLYYEDVGSGSPVVLVHGWPLSQRLWDQQVRPLVAAGYRVVSYDRRGFGRSSHPWNGYDVETFAADLARVVESLQLHDATLVGFSSGCADVLRYVEVHGTTRLSRLVLISPPPDPDPADAVTLHSGGGLVAASMHHRVAMLDEVVGRMFAVDGLPAVDEPTRQFHVALAAGASAKAVTDSIIAADTANLGPALGAVDVPVFAIVGGGDALTDPARVTRWLAGSAPKIRVTTVPHAPHAVPVTHAEECNAAVLASLTS